MFKKLDIASIEIKRIQKKLDDLQFTYESFIENDAKTKFFTGLPSYKLLFKVHDRVGPYLSTTVRSALSTFQQLIVTLMKLRFNHSFEYLSYR